MKRSSYEQFAIVKTDSASLFEEQLNEETYRLRDKHPVVVFSDHIPFYAQIKYTVNTEAPESISEEYEMVGACFVCEQCPHFQPMLRRDGEEDPRFRYGDCEYAELGRTHKNTPACDILYELIHKREVKLCFTK